MPSQFVDATRLLEIIFEEKSRPSLRWLRERQAAREIPFVKRGRKVFFDPAVVREFFNSQATIKAK